MAKDYTETFGYDLVGNFTQRKPHGSKSKEGQGLAQVEYYTYDNKKCMIRRESIEDKTYIDKTLYAYDAQGNTLREESTAGITEYQYNSCSRASYVKTK